MWFNFNKHAKVIFCKTILNLFSNPFYYIFSFAKDYVRHNLKYNFFVE